MVSEHVKFMLADVPPVYDVTSLEMQLRDVFDIIHFSHPAMGTPTNYSAL